MVTNMNAQLDVPAEPDAPDELFMEFANTLEYTRGEPEDSIPTPDELLAWLRRHELISERARAAEASRLRRDAIETETRMSHFRHLRTMVHDIARRVSAAQTPTQDQLRELNTILRTGLHYHQLRLDDDGTRYTVAQVGDRLDQAAAAIASSLAHFLADDAPDRLRVCANQGCRYVFVDRSPTGRRRWCDMRTCGNQAKVARHRARAKAKPGG